MSMENQNMTEEKIKVKVFDVTWSQTPSVYEIANKRAIQILLSVAQKHGWRCFNKGRFEYLLSKWDKPVVVSLLLQTDYSLKTKKHYVMVREASVRYNDCYVILNRDWSIHIKLADFELKYNGRLSDSNDASYMLISASNEEQLAQELDQLLNDQNNTLTKLFQGVQETLNMYAEYIAHRIKVYFVW